nr:fibrinopeptide A [Anas platyrhynchos]
EDGKSSFQKEGGGVR